MRFLPRLLPHLLLGMSWGALSPAFAQGGARITGRITASQTGEPVAHAMVELEGLSARTASGQDGRILLDSVPPGPQVLRVIRIGFAPLRHPIVVPSSGTLELELVMAASALNLPGLIVTSDPSGRARGELTTASVVEREAIRNQVATWLAGILELVPGVVLSPPSLDRVQQLSLRAVPISAGGSTGTIVAGQPSAEQAAAFGTQVVVDGIPVSNNANFQSLGPGGELNFPSSAGGGVDLRRYPAAAIERVARGRNALISLSPFGRRIS